MGEQYLAMEAQIVGAARFWSKVQMRRSDADQSYCWEWRGAKDQKGYGIFRPSGEPVIRAHRYSWRLVFGGIFSDSLQVCHHCDNPSCVRPTHLFLGTNAENMADRERKGRGVRQSGENHHAYKVTPQAAAEMRAACASGEKQRDVASRYGVSQTTVWRAVNQTIGEAA